MMLILLILLFSTLCYLLLNLYVLIMRRSYQHIKAPPVSASLTWFLGILPDFQRRLSESPNVSAACALMQYHYDYGWDLYVLHLFTRNVIVCLELDIIAKVSADWRTFQKDPDYQKVFAQVNGVRIFGKYGLISDPGTEVWNAKRRAMDPGFHKSFMKSIMPGMNSVVDNLLMILTEKAKKGAIDVTVDLNQSAFEAISLCGFNMSFDVLAKHGPRVMDSIPVILQNMTLSFRDSSFKYPWKFQKEKEALKEAVPAMRELIKTLLRERMDSDTPGRSDILSHIINSNLCSDQLTIDDLVDDYLVFLMAGMETTAITMGIAFFYLSNNNDIFAKVRNEIDNVVKRGESMSFEDVNKLEYVDMVIKESMRLKPPVRGVGRYAKQNVVVNSFKIPKGGEIFVPFKILHCDSRYWSRPEVFDPERFSPKSKRKVTPFTYLPFMAGARSCIGKNFAMLEAKMIVSRVVQEFDIENPRPDVTDLEMSGLLTARPLDGVNLILRPRPF